MKMKKGLFTIIITLLVVACGQRQKVEDRQEQDTVMQDTVSDYDVDSYPIRNDSFTVVYRQPVKGYKVAATLKPSNYDCFVSSAHITFTKEGKSFTLHTECFGDTMFCKGRYDYDHVNSKIFRQYRNKTVNADYHFSTEKDRLMPYDTPFFFKDMDFDGKEELVIVHYSWGVRFHDGYDIYRIVEGEPFRIDYPPYNDNVKDWGFGMTDYPEFDYKAKTISCPCPEGEMTYGSRIIYGVSKKEKDIVVVNGKKHYFNHMEVIKEIKYE